MRLASLRTAGGTRAVRRDGDEYVDLGVTDVGALLARPDWPDLAGRGDGARYPVAGADLAPVVPSPGKILCVGQNYRAHILEMGREVPQYPTMFAKYPEALIGPNDPIELAPESDAVDWEAELAIVIGRPVRRASADDAAAAIAGFTVLNDVTMRDWQFRTMQWLQGKTWERTSPVGPVLVTPDELPGGVRPSLSMSCTVDGETVQKASTGDLVFDPVFLVQYLSTILTLRPGDLIASGTPGGVGHARKPPRYLHAGARLVTEISDIGRLDNLATAP
ncbi:MAG TPA: fumarylacetoacetate hydrolase family protein [Pseudonocardiaceae bacterium]|jgi:acylpyruvate hydrolase